MTFACKLAIEFRQKFKRDIVIDMWCYRRFGHNEGDEPSFTQPLMYAAIRQHPPISEVYGERLIAEGVIEKAGSTPRSRRSPPCSKASSRPPNPICPTRPTGSAARWAGLNKPSTPETARRNVGTAVDEPTLREIGKILTTVPEGFAIHKTLQRILDAKKEMFETGADFDWATAEALAFGTWCARTIRVRLSGQDSGRGTFSQRHSVWVDQNKGAKYIPLTKVGPARFEVLDSPLSEFGVLGFEYG